MHIFEIEKDEATDNARESIIVFSSVCLGKTTCNFGNDFLMVTKNDNGENGHYFLVAVEDVDELIDGNK